MKKGIILISFMIVSFMGYTQTETISKKQQLTAVATSSVSRNDRDVIKVDKIETQINSIETEISETNDEEILIELNEKLMLLKLKKKEKEIEEVKEIKEIE
tara:strand:+ start:657 stop:959 length:303 start_codon:yes stop_codon:yes gene_type:complete